MPALSPAALRTLAALRRAYATAQAAYLSSCERADTPTWTTPTIVVHLAARLHSRNLIFDAFATELAASGVVYEEDGIERLELRHPRITSVVEDQVRIEIYYSLEEALDLLDDSDTPRAAFPRGDALVFSLGEDDRLTTPAHEVYTRLRLDGTPHATALPLACLA